MSLLEETGYMVTIGEDPDTLVVDRREWEWMHRSLVESYRMLAESLDTNLMLSEKLTNAQARWLGRDAQTTN